MRISDWSSDVCSSDLIASASIDDPSGRICDVIFPIAGKDKLAAIIKESQAKGALDRRIYKVMRRSWANHYRRMLPSLLSALEFRSNNAVWCPVLAALDWIRSKVDDGCRYVPPHAVPGDEVIPARWRSSVIDEEGRVNRISYELCVLAQLRDRIRRSEEHTSELQSLMRISYAVFCLKKKNKTTHTHNIS